MLKVKMVIIICLGIILSITNQGFAQKSKGGHHSKGGHTHGKTKVVAIHHQHPNTRVIKSLYRPKSLVVFHPVWGPKRNFNRRWVYFPRHNFYWDNWRKIYVYRSGNVWIHKPTPPPVVVNISIDNEKHYELKETEDDLDDVYKINESHQKEYKPQ